MNNYDDKEQKKIILGYKLMKKLKPVAEVLSLVLLLLVLFLLLKTFIKGS